MTNSSDLLFYKQSLDYILKVQSLDGAIAWELGEKLDPWDHVEAAMGLSIGGEVEAAKKAYLWLKNKQEDDGSWFAEYRDSQPSSERKESNFAAYIATGLWHHYLITEDKEFLKLMFPILKKAMEFVISLQTKFGDIHWASEGDIILDDSLITGCSSIYKSLDCAIAIYRTLEREVNFLVDAKNSLKRCLIENPNRFDRGWKSKSRYSMDWYYPIMCGIIKNNDAKVRLESRWEEFIVEGKGCKCVEEEPWVTIAESSELAVALVTIGEINKAKMVFNWLHQWKDKEDGLYWTGYVYTDKKYWPIEKPTWTAAAVILAADTIFKITPGSDLFLKDWEFD